MGKAARELIVQLRKWIGAAGAEAGDDESLLRRFHIQGDEEAFAALVDRYGPLVLGVCRQVLGDAHAAEDAFQATFLILARKAGSVQRRRALAAWLHRVAGNVARTARTAAARRRHHEQQAAMNRPPDVVEAPDTSGWPILHAAIDGLPEKYRVPVVLCYLQGKTNEEAARELGWPVGTVKSSLARARECLRGRLEGLGLAGTLTLLGTGRVHAAVPPTLAAATTRSAIAFATGQAAGKLVSASVAGLVEGGLRNMGTSKTQVALTLGLAVALLGGGAGLVLLKTQANPPLNPDRGVRPNPEKPAAAVRPAPLQFQSTDLISTLAVTPDGKILAVGGHRNSVSVFDLTNGKKLQDFSGDGGIVAAVAFSPDGKTLAVGGSSSTIRLWDVPGGRERRKIEGKELRVDTLAFSPDGKLLATSGGNHTGAIYLWDVGTGKELSRIFGHERGTDAIVFSADGKILASIGTDKDRPGVQGRGTVRVWDRANGKLRAEWTGIRGGPNVLALSADGRILVQGGENAPVRLLDTTTGKQLRTIDGLSMVHSLALSPDGRLLVTASGYQKYVLQLWEVATGTELRCLTELPSEWSRVNFCSDGRLVWGSGQDIRVLREDGISLSQDRLPASGELRLGDLDALWAALASTDGRRAYEALAKLRASPQLALALLKEHLRAAAAPDREKIGRFIADLDSDEPAARARASRELERIGSPAIPFLKKSLADRPSLEVRRRIEDLLERSESKTVSAEIIRAQRAIQLLEALEASEAVRLLEQLAEGAADEPITGSAKAALQRRTERSRRSVPDESK